MLCCVEFHLYFFVEFLATPLKYFTLCLESFYIPCFVLCSAVVEHCLSCVYVLYMFGCVLTENCECLITVFLLIL